MIDKRCKACGAEWLIDPFPAEYTGEIQGYIQHTEDCLTDPQNLAVAILKLQDTVKAIQTMVSNGVL